MPAPARPPNERPISGADDRIAPSWQQWFTSIWRDVAPSDHSYIPAASGVPTGIPEARAGFVAMRYDTANNDLYVFNSSWVKITLS